MKHEKHKVITRPDWGDWGRNEWAIVGGKCKDIQRISNEVISINTTLNTLYIDADHKSHDEGGALDFETVTRGILDASSRTARRYCAASSSIPSACNHTLQRQHSQSFHNRDWQTREPDITIMKLHMRLSHVAADNQVSLVGRLPNHHLRL